MTSIFLVVILLALAGLALYLWGRRQQRAAGLPAGRVTYSDTGAEHAVTQPLISRRYGLIGKPDYLVETTIGGRRTMIPVEVKSRRAPAAPLPGHLLQLATYCLIIEDVYGAAPPHGVLRYADRSFETPFTPDLRRAVLDAADRIRASQRAADMPRSHQERQRCAHCGYRRACGDQALTG
ncbi:MAG: CRISPR-associated protein Cas4 [Chloroflexota bacterium]|jgi:CRISPR-associated exonuclease Cas4|nr:Dna2/Cas4 domain-containing protein [Caldilinea sp.]GIK72569.1 MAG: CRISPR-associated protein Cas4 [Chloroflexota bacterium]